MGSTAGTVICPLSLVGSRRVGTAHLFSDRGGRCPPYFVFSPHHIPALLLHASQSSQYFLGRSNFPSLNALAGMRRSSHFARSLAAFASSGRPSARYALTICTYAASD